MMSAIRHIKNLERTVQSQKNEKLYEKVVSQWEKVRADRYHRDPSVRGPSEQKIRDILADTNPSNHTRRLQAAAWALGFGANLGTYSIDGKRGFFTRQAFGAMKQKLNFRDSSNQFVEDVLIERARDKMIPLTREETALRDKAGNLVWLRLNPRDQRQMERLKDYVGSLPQLRKTAESGDYWKTVIAASAVQAKARALGIPETFVADIHAEAVKISLGQKGELPGEGLAKLIRTPAQNA